jgi:SAM-dependent methyltransferase
MTMAGAGGEGWMGRARDLLKRSMGVAGGGAGAGASADRRAAAHPDGNDYKTFWNGAAIADAQEWIFTGATAESFEESGRGDVRRLLPLIGPAAKVLNIGCGIGRVDRYLAPHVGELWGVDISGEMVRRARERLAELPNVHVREVALGEFLSSFGSQAGTFDLVFSLLVLQHMEREDAFRYLEDSHRVLKPGGALFLQFPNFLSPEYTEAFREGARLNQRSASRVRTYTEAEVRHLLPLAGFEVVDLEICAGREGNAEIYVTGKKPV